MPTRSVARKGARPLVPPALAATPSPVAKEPIGTVKVFDFFAGCGGASCGFREAGMEIAFALDWDSDAADTYSANFPSTMLVQDDIRNVSADDIYTLVDDCRPGFVLFCGCAPCQPFSQQNTIHPDDDDRVHLLSHFTEFVQRCLPDVVFLENVPGLQSFSDRLGPFGDFVCALEADGYHVDHRPIRLMRYGIPQTRRRLVLLASRHGPIELPARTNGPGTPKECYETVREWIGDLPRIEAGEQHSSMPNHQAARLSPRNLERIRSTPEGGGHASWPEHLKLECHARTSGYTDVYGRMHWDRPASALTTRCISYSNGRYGHPEQDRAISIREAACLQTFPRDFAFRGSSVAMARQIGNAVPVRLASIMGRHITSHLRRNLRQETDK